MNELIFPPENELGVLFQSYYYMPYIVFKIEVSGKEYRGTLQSIRVKDLGKTLISGKFYPDLPNDFFEAFNIYPNNFELKIAIDLKAPDGDTTINSIFQIASILEKAIGNPNIVEVRGIVYYALLELKKGMEKFMTFHPEINLERSLNLVNESLDKASILNVQMPIKKEEVLLILQYIVDNIKLALTSFLTSPKF